MSASFEARYSGRCPLCEKGWLIGDLIFYNDDDLLVHVSCPSPALKSHAQESLCPVCWLIHPDGACDR